jgi:L-Lysine epsilon oxidase N-terminal/L-lysine epsilon oxidase C-terminal domain
MPITTVKIFPSIGIARIGNSPEFFIGPEIPGDRPAPPGGYKDLNCRIKRQAARFRLFGYDQNGNLVQEITTADANISWTVHLANKKSSWRQFAGLSDNAAFRNGGVADRGSLEIDPGAQTLNGPNQAAGFNTGRFLGQLVPLGEMRTDAQGLLIMLGGFGNSGSVPPGQPIGHYANNDNWHDDVSDGPITASVILNGTVNAIPASPAWVICPPPDFAPPIDSLTNLYDTLFQVAVDKGWSNAPVKPSFTNDIWPILQRVFNLQRTSQLADSGHFDFDGNAAAAMNQARRAAVFGRLRNPNNPGAAGTATMPKIYDDSEGTQQTVTKVQYSILQKWAGVEGTDWTLDWPGAPPSPPANITPDGLTRAALEACVGGAFFPGIEGSWFLRDTAKQGAFDYTEPFRLDHTGHGAGDLTRQMAVPWQSDFWKCRTYGGHAWWPAQRPDDVFPLSGGGPLPWTREIVNSHVDMIEQWHKLGFIVSQGGSFVETERRKVCTNIFLITDRSSFSDDEVNAVLNIALPAQFDDAFFVVAEGFLPADLGLAPGVSTTTLTPAVLQPIAPAIVLRRADNTVVPGMGATVQKVLAEIDPPPANQLQRFTYSYRVEFTNANAFVTDLEEMAVAATKGTFTASGKVTLFKKANPYMVDGATTWLSTDVRVFKVFEGQSPFGPQVGALGGDATAALTFINNTVTQFRTLGHVGHPFDALSTDQSVSQLQLAEKENNQRVFNFAVARVRYRGNLGAPNVRVFFRLFTVAATGVDFDENSTYRRTPGATPIALLGLQAEKLVTIPCYGHDRVDTSAVSLTSQVDDLNTFSLQPLGGATEFWGYFGCWLDINQTTKRFPVDVAGSPDGPWSAGSLQSVQDLIRGLHQCLVAEVYFVDDPTPFGSSPAASDNLAQRNLVIVESANPGDSATRTVQHPFEIKATRPSPQLVFGAAGDIEARRTPRVLPAGPDELMIRWNNLPRTTRLTLYMPDVDVDDILKLAGQNYEAQRLQRVDAHTILCLPGDVTYIPLPQGRNRNIAALATMALPEGVKRGQRFDAVIHQISGRPRKILGTVQFTIPVKTSSVLLAPEIRSLSVLRHIYLSIPVEDPWHSVFQRYLDQIADRVRGFGGDPDEVAPTADGSGRDPAAERCARFGWIVSGLLALVMFLGALHPSTSPLPQLIVFVGLAAVTLLWRTKCSPSICQWTTAVQFGLGLGAFGIIVLLLAGIGGSLALWILALTLLALVLVLSVGLRWRCFRFAGR